jgi:O-antigen ligase
MSYAPPIHPPARLAAFGSLSRLIGAVLAVFGLTLGAALVVDIMGYWALTIPLYAGLATAVIVAPRWSAFVLLGLTIAIEPGAIDITKPLSIGLYEMPPRIAGFFPFTVHPLEVLLTLLAVALVVRGRGKAKSRPALPAVVWLLPAFIALGLGWGLANGGAANEAWHELRGLVFGTIAFVATVYLSGDIRAETARRTVLGATLALAIIMIIRHFWFVVYIDAGIPSQFLYRHEDAIFLAIGFVASFLYILWPPKGSARTPYLLHSAIVLFAMMASGRRAAILALIVAVVILAWMLLRHRPWMVLAASVPVVIAGGLYLSVFWQQESGVLAQPARAIRSQIDPSDRDASSDEYRRREVQNVRFTIDKQPLLGVGFGNPYELVQPLPVLDFWSLQFHTPHQNVLWLWLKMGVLGIAAFLTTWLIAFRRAIVTARLTDPKASILPLALASVLLMYLFFASIDLALVAARSAVPLAIALALAFGLASPERQEGHVHDAGG